MKNPKSYLKGKLTEEELKEFLKALAHDNVVKTILLKLITSREVSCDNREDLLKDPSYPFQRAYLDGRFKELGWFKDILTQGDSNDE